MRRQSKLCLLALSLVLGITPAAFGQGGTFSPIDFPGSTSTLAWSINKGGDIAGTYTIAGLNHGFKLTGGKLITIDYPGATNTDVRGINNRGDISGIYRNADGVFHGFVSSGDRFTSIDFPNATLTQGWGLNSSGDVVGNYTIAGVNHGFKWSAGQFTTIDFPGSTITNLTGINQQGEVSGIYTIAGITHGFLLSDGEFTALDVPETTYTNTTALTAHGEIIGRYTVGTVANGYFLRGGLFNTIAFPNATFTRAASMNERGDMVGRYQNADGVFHGFLLSGFQSGCVAYAPRVAVTSGGAAVTHASDFTLVTTANPAAPGELLSLFLAGLGPTRPGVDPGKPFPLSPLAAVTSPVEVRANGKPAEVLGAVGFPGAVDGYQVNFRLPAETPKGLASLQVSTGMVADTSVKLMVK